MGEIVLILVVALLALGPDKLPKAVGQISNAIRGFRKQTKELQSTLEQDTKFGDAVREIKSAMYDDPSRPRPKPRPKPAATPGVQRPVPSDAKPDPRTQTASAATAEPKEPGTVASSTYLAKRALPKQPGPVAGSTPVTEPEPEPAIPAPAIAVTAASDTVAKDDSVAADSNTPAADADESAHG